MHTDTPFPVDPHAVNGKIPAPAEHYGLVVVGAGPAGIAAAREGAAAGKRVLLVDEHPVPGHLMGTDVPLFFGGRMTAATQNPGRMIESVFATLPELEAAMEDGIELLLGTAAWGVYRNGPAIGTLPAQMLGLADAERGWMVGFDELVLATGARDLALAFPGWNQPGVMGAGGFAMLVARYQAFAGRRIVIMGSHDLAVETARLAQEHGIEVAALVETRDAPQADVGNLPLHASCVIAEAIGGIDGVKAVRLSDGTEIACDTVVQAVGAVPAIELIDAMGGARVMDPARGGWVPADNGTVRCVGLAAGLPDTGFDHMAYRAQWVDALGAVSAPDTIVCQCEEVTRADLIGVQPPNYLKRPPAMCARSLDTLLADGPPNQDQIKRLTRAGMGQCQGRRCREQVSLILGAASGKPVPLASHRAPVRPIPLKILADWEEDQSMRDGWDVWFGIPTQWIPYRDIGTDREKQHQDVIGGNMSL